MSVFKDLSAKQNRAVREDFNQVVKNENIDQIWINIEPRPLYSKPFRATISYNCEDSKIEKRFSADNFNDLMEKIGQFIKTHSK